MRILLSARDTIGSPNSHPNDVKVNVRVHSQTPAKSTGGANAGAS